MPSFQLPKRTWSGSAEVAQRLRALTTLPEDPGSIPAPTWKV